MPRKKKRLEYAYRFPVAKAVVQDAEAYQRLPDIAAHADVFEAIRQGFDDVALGRTRPLGKCSTKSAASMPYSVELTARARRDLDDLY
ncbi:MAG: hypothetical protein LAQ69_32400 [Acidobacteriia bacterium]|nr:hypothetical protein [Terriglobia bacterium]